MNGTWSRTLVAVAHLGAGILCCSASAQGDVGRWVSLGPAGEVQVFSVRIDPVTPTTLYAATGIGVFKSSDAGVSWARKTVGLGAPFVTDLALDPTVPSTLYVGTAAYNVGTVAGVYKSVDGGEHWAASSTGISATTSISALVIDPVSPSVLYAGSSGGGIFRSTDAAATWTPINGGLLDLSIQTLTIDPTSPNTLFAGSIHSLFRSTNGGAVWQRVYDVGQEGVFTIRIDPRSASTLYAGIMYYGPLPDPLPPPGGVIKSTDGGTTWSRLGNGLPNLGVRALAISPGPPATIYAGTWGTGVYVSRDEGATWSALIAGPITSDVYSLEFDRSGTLYAGTFRGAFRLVPLGGTCASGPDSLCLGDGRFRIVVEWRATSLGASGRGQSVAVSADSGHFWFFDPRAVELTVKVVDGRAFNGKFWFFYGALSDVEYTIGVTDLVTGVVKTYFNPQGRLASVGDVTAF